MVFELFFAGLAFFAAAPLWLVDHPPIQDLPQHLATIRVLVDHGDANLAFADYFDVELGRTQYLAYYLAAQLLSLGFGVALANKLLITAAIVGTPYAMRYLLRTLNRDEGHALFVLPLTWNAHLILGFLNFIAAIPLMFLGLALAVGLRHRFETRRAVALGVVALVAFYTHVVPFAFLALGAAMVGVGVNARETAKRWLPLAPAGVATLFWLARSPAGEATMNAALLGADEGPRPVFMNARQAIHQLPVWLTDVFHGPFDDRLLMAFGACLLLAVLLGRPRTPADRELIAGLPRLLWRVGLLAPIAAVAYFVAPVSYDWIWPINTRFPLLALLLFIPLLRPPRRWADTALHSAVVVIAILSFQQASRAALDFEAEEVGELDAAVEAIPEGSRVAGLIFASGSQHVKFSPFLHSVAYVQAERGGAVMFTFADFPHSPIRFRENNRPPRVPPRWEWTPARVDPARDLDWYEYVLTRGGPGRIAAIPSRWEPIFEREPWRIYRRRDPIIPAATPP